ncbi:hypothetical protein BDV95DRAFT_443995, partial [Massariosphaeria phaeospora]
AMEPIAVVGFSFKFPEDATSSEGFWNMLMTKRTTMKDWPKDRINIDGYHSTTRREGSSVAPRGASFLKDDVSLFDAPFFSISAAEAAAMDPQQRILLETSYHAFENAGLPLENLRGSSTGVYVGTMCDDYRTITQRDIENMPTYGATGASVSILANRLSWFYDLRGPSITLDSACSSSLMAVHFACQALRTGDASTTLVAGTNMLLAVESLILMTRMGFLSPDSRCFSFDHRANGYARGEGVGVVVLKRLSDAIRDHDTIRAVIQSTGANQDGNTPGITVPSQESQAELIRHTYEKAGLDLGSTRYFEAHGTGTPVGDPKEAAAIGSVFREHRSPSDPLYVGTLKPNIGHLEGASGIAALIKSILVVEKGIIPPNANIEKPKDPTLAEYFNLKLPLEPTPWPSTGIRRASINSFGFGGSNAHVVIQDAGSYLESRGLVANHCTWKRELDTSSEHDNVSSGYAEALKTNGTSDSGIELSSESTDGHALGPKLLWWSAADKEALAKQQKAYEAHFSENSDMRRFTDEYFLDLAYTLSARRSRLAWRSFTVSTGVKDLSNLTKQASSLVRAKSAGRILFVFTGQGAQYKRMGAGLLQYPVFRRAMMAFDSCLFKFGCSWSVVDELIADDGNTSIDDPAYSQPLCTAIQIGLVELLRTFRIVPSAVIGHSSGEIAAAYTAGSLSFESACRVSYYRGLLSSQLTNGNSNGTMLAASLTEEQARLRFKKLGSSSAIPLTVACVNSPSSVTIAGNRNDIAALKKELDSEGIFQRELSTGVAYHSSQMETIANEYLEALSGIEAGEGSTRPICMASTVTGDFVGDTKSCSSPEYWVKNMVQTVRFSESLQLLLARPNPETGATMDFHDIIEIGPHAALQRPVKDILAHVEKEVRYSSALSRFKPATTSIMELAGTLLCSGHDISLEAVNGLESAQHRTLTDLPEYNFSRESYWHESSISKNLRRRPHFPRPLLGAPTADWNPTRPKWRRYLSVNDLAWIPDHKIKGKILLPAAGMVEIALEAVNEVSPDNHDIEGFLVKEVTFSTAIMLDSEGENTTELEIFLSTPLADVGKNSAFHEVDIFVLQSGEWTLACHAVVQAQHFAPLRGLDDGSETQRKMEFSKAEYHGIASACKPHVEHEELYERFAKLGFEYGPRFQELQEVSYSDQRSAISEILHTEPEGPEEFIVHPSLLDAVAQLGLAAGTKGGSAPLPTSLPTRMCDAWFSKRGISESTGKPLRACATSTLKGFTKTDGSAIVLDHTGEPVISIAHMETTMIASDYGESGEAVRRGLSYTVEYKQDVDCFDSRISSVVENQESSLDDVARWFISDVLAKITPDDIDRAKPHIKQYIDWMIEQEYLATSDVPANSDLADEEKREKYLTSLSAQSKEAERMVFSGKMLLKIIRDEFDPLEIANEPQVIPEELQQQLESYVSLVAHKTPGMSILEVGMGAPSVTRRLIESLYPNDVKHGKPVFSQYDCTDRSQEAVDRIKDGLAEFSETGPVKIKQLNLELDLENQGFDLENYDLVLLDSDQYTTGLNPILNQTRKILKPGGRLILLKRTRSDSLVTQFTQGLLPRWWVDQESRDMLPSPTQISEELLKAGFSGQRQLNPQSELIAHLASTSEVVDSQLADQIVTLVVDSNSSLQSDVASCVESILERQGAMTVILPFDKLKTGPDLTNRLVVFLPEVERSIIQNLEESSYDTLKASVASGRLLWVTRSQSDPEALPDQNMIMGLARALRAEKQTRTFARIGLQNVDDTGASAATICEALKKLVTPQDVREIEYEIKDDTFHIPRLMEVSWLDRKIHSKIHPQERYQKIGQSPPLSLTIASPGMLDTLQWVADEEYEKPLAPGEVEVEVRAIGLNFRDVVVALGRLDDDAFGCECSGVVRRVGDGVALSPGARVIAGKIGCMKMFARCNADLVYEIPDDFSFEEAAAFPLVAITAYYSVIEMGRLQPEDSVLIHAGAGATGQMCIQIAQHIGAEVYATVGSQEKKQFLISHYGVPEDHIFDSRSAANFSAGIMRMTEKRGVDMVVNSLGGERLKASWDLIAKYGRFVEIGKDDIMGNSKLPMSCFEGNVSFIAVAIDHMINNRPKLVKKLLHAVEDMRCKGVIRAPYPIHIRSISQVEESFRFLQTGKSTGKIVFAMGNDAEVKTYMIDKCSYRLDSNSTYMIAGGLGGLGRSCASWMVTNGARHLILVSRSGPKTAAAQEFVQDLRASGVRVETPKCDLSSTENLRTVLESCAVSMPPVKGCVQGTMVLKDALFENMIFAEWNEAITSKVASSWNLHQALPRGMDFFVMLSSVIGIVGKVGQANYAAGNTYQDALARYRRQRGERAVSLDLGAMNGVGIIAENALQQRQTKGMFRVEEAEFLALLDHFCDPATYEKESTCPTQLVFGIPTLDWMKIDNPALGSDALFTRMAQLELLAKSADAGLNDGIAHGDSFAQDFLRATSIAEAETVVIEGLKAKLCKALSIPAENIDSEKPLHSYGVDSLVGLELRNWLAKEFAANIAIFDLIKSAHIAEVAALVTSTS